MSTTRLISLADAPALAALLRDNREFLAPWEPERGEDYFSQAGQEAAIRNLLASHEQGTGLPHVILDEDGAVSGRINLNDIVRGCFQSCHLGYWLGAASNGRGLATAAVRELVGIAFGELGLHRVQAATLVHNARSQRVLARNGFTRIGVAPGYLRIAGRWQDHTLYQRLSGDHAA